MSHWPLQGLWQLLQPDGDQHLPRLLAMQELEPMEKPQVPSSRPALHMLSSDMPEPEPEVCMHACGLHCGSNFQALLTSRSRPPVSLARKPKASPSDVTVQAEPVLRPSVAREPAVTSRMKDAARKRVAVQQGGFCGFLCGQECAQNLQATFRMTRPTFGRPPARSGICDPDAAMNSCRSDGDCDPCAAMLWIRPPDLPALPSDVDLDDTGDCNRQTVRPRFWRIDPEEEEGMVDAIRQVHMSEEEDTLRSPLQPPHSPPAQSPQSDNPSYLVPPSPESAKTNSHFSLNSILHKPGTRSEPSPGPTRIVHFTVSPEEDLKARQARPFVPRMPKSKAAPKRSADSGVLWHLIPGS
mmetsp:Transcript_14544/g.34590  ORF Transcript_14544/g.34590 Transcript_14544/m.34590 type:complete len:354 (-) Transcript_14544:74-1135(-)